MLSLQLQLDNRRIGPLVPRILAVFANRPFKLSMELNGLYNSYKKLVMLKVD